MRPSVISSAAAALAFLLVSADVASAQQTLNFSLGYFTIRGEDGRVDGDVLVENRDVFRFDIGDFNSPSVGFEWLVPIGDFVEAGAGVHFTSRTVATTYRDFTRPDGGEIEQDTKLRVTPISGTVRLLPLGRNNPFQPYVGGGIAAYNYRYSETGDFVDFSLPGRPIFRESFSESGTVLGPVAVFGARFAGDRFSVGGEVRYQKAEGDLDERDFFGPRLDLGGLHYSATFGVRF